MVRPPPTPTLFPYTTLFRSGPGNLVINLKRFCTDPNPRQPEHSRIRGTQHPIAGAARVHLNAKPAIDRKSTRLNSSHPSISYAVFCLKKKTIPLFSRLSQLS